MDYRIINMDLPVCEFESRLLLELKLPYLLLVSPPLQVYTKSPCLKYNMVKAQLFQIIKDHKQPPEFEADIVLEAHEHKMVRLPPYHCDLNPIEPIWSVLKTNF
ncbi:unnamed protein product [Euphydryas editha]|uniref:Tc1-like transposase DDE domain-containing protein n=1 Tax=Euphydryas editha TaxID=104508 RepID=A0AAU9UQ36_EUPED|nr:unnamed protein product [Euphydryas editha]